MKKKLPDNNQIKTLSESSNHAISPHLLRQVLDGSSVAMAIRDTELTPVFTNQAFRDFYGQSEKFLRNTPKDILLPESTLALYANGIQPIMASGLTWEGTYDIRTKAEGLKTVWGRFTPVLDGTGSLTHIISIMRDALDFSRIQNALSRTEHCPTSLSGNTRDCPFSIRLSDGRLDCVGSAIENITGYNQQELCDPPRLLHRLFPNTWEETLNQWWQELKQGISRYEYKLPLIHRDGTRKWVHLRVRLTFDDTRNPVAIEGLVTDVTDRHKTENALVSARQNLKFISNSSTDIFFRVKIPEGTYDYLSPSVERFSGFALEEFEANPLFLREIVHPDWQGYIHETWEEMLRGEVRPVYEFQYVRKSGEVRWANQRLIMHRDGDGRGVAIEGFVTDVTERKVAEEIAKESEHRFRTLFEDSPISLWEEDLSDLKAYFDELKEQGITDFQKFFIDNPETLVKCAALVKVVNINKATLSLLGAKTKEELLGNLQKVLTKSSMDAFTEEMILLASGGCEYCGEITHRTLNGDTIWVTVHFLVPPEYADSLSRVIVSLQDVTRRKRAEEALRDSEERYRILAENSREGVVVLQGHEVKYINKRMTDIFEHDAREFDRDKFIKSIFPDDRESILKQLEKLLAGKEKTLFTSFKIVTGKNQIKWLTLVAKPIMWNGQEARLKIITDVTSHKALEEELLRAHALMEDRVNKRTAELSKANLQLKAEARERNKAQDRILSLTQQLVLIQEEERQRISRDLHDNVAQDMSSVILRMETLFDNHPSVDEKLRSKGKDVTGILHKAIASVRDIAYGLRSPALEQMGLVGALEGLCKDASSKHAYNVDFFATGIEDVLMDFDAKINIYRIIQEAVRNISRHAEATKATLRMVKSHPDILIRIEDNGRGFDRDKRLKEAAAAKRMGVRSMEERTRLIGGTMEIQSLPGTGTRLLFKIPIENARRRE